jgi:isochorismate synthase
VTSEEILARLDRARAGLGASPGPCAVRLRLDGDVAAAAWLRAFSREASDPAAARFYWHHPSAGLRMLGLGAFRVCGGEGADRFGRVAGEVADCLGGLRIAGDAGPAACGPSMLGGFAFSPHVPDEPACDRPWHGFPAGRFVLPELLLCERDETLWLSVCLDADSREIPARTVSRLVDVFDEPSVAPAAAAFCGFDLEGPAGMAAGPEYRVRSDRSHADYRAQVEAARHAIAAGDLEKVVLARSLRVRHDGRFDVPGLLVRLERLYPECTVFAVGQGASCFLGATPELLVARQGRSVRTSALAGSAPRGRTPEDDARIARRLRESKKEQGEHAVVVRAIQQGLSPLCDDLEVPEAPGVLRLQGIQHLHTPIEGRLAADSGARGPASLLELGARLHPTPAVGGAPTRAALEWIERCEGFDRGWYAAPVGFVDREGCGELRVALRSALLRHGDRGDEALLFAGGGIVADSDPEAELEETRIKLRALLAPLTEI